MAGSSLFDRVKKSLAASAGDIVFGMEDGTVSIFGLVLGVAATTNDNATVLIAGASGACAAAVSMMAGTYLEVETNLDEARTFNARLAADVERDPEAVVDRVAGRLKAAGLASAESALVVDLIRSKPRLLQGVASAMTAPAAPETIESPLAHSLWMLFADFVSAAIPDPALRADARRAGALGFDRDHHAVADRPWRRPRPGRPPAACANGGGNRCDRRRGGPRRGRDRPRHRTCDLESIDCMRST